MEICGASVGNGPGADGIGLRRRRRGGQHARANSDSIPNAYSHANPDSITDTYSDADPYADAHAHANSDANSHTHSTSHLKR